MHLFQTHNVAPHPNLWPLQKSPDTADILWGGEPLATIESHCSGKIRKEIRKGKNEHEQS